VQKNNLIKGKNIMNEVIEKDLSKSGVLTLRLNRPEVLNAMNADLILGLLEAFNDAKVNKEVRSVLLTGNGRGFCSGADLVDGGWPNPKGISPGEAAANNMENAFNPLVKAITQSNKPVVNAVNGIAAGGGVGLALSGDLVIASKSAKFKLVFGPNLGIIPDVGASWFVPNLIGRARANGMGLLGEDISAEKAKEWGLIWDCVADEDLITHCTKIAEKIANGPIEGLKSVVKAHDNSLSSSLSDQLDYEKNTQRVRLDTKDFKEGVSAFVEKRKPNFRDIKN
jgi:2-(1,2-epoxy-1,2-dihydrophenyl)acetyl-CoA isomerase|tara:strand:+ start:8821 stop:9666 length:846 start_codon:yes stop_codon:yes gene_type:complete